MITSSLERIIDIFKQHIRLMFNNTYFSMSYQLGINYLTSESINYPLMAKANSKDRYCGPQISYYVSTNSEIFTICRVTRSWRYNYCIRIHFLNVLYLYFVVPDDCRPSFKLAQ